MRKIWREISPARKEVDGCAFKLKMARGRWRRDGENAVEQLDAQLAELRTALTKLCSLFFRL